MNNAMNVCVLKCVGNRADPANDCFLRDRPLFQAVGEASAIDVFRHDETSSGFEPDVVYRDDSRVLQAGDTSGF